MQQSLTDNIANISIDMSFIITLGLKLGCA